MEHNCFDEHERVSIIIKLECRSLSKVSLCKMSLSQINGQRVYLELFYDKLKNKYFAHNKLYKQVVELTSKSCDYTDGFERFYITFTSKQRCVIPRPCNSYKCTFYDALCELVQNGFGLHVIEEHLGWCGLK